MKRILIVILFLICSVTVSSADKFWRVVVDNYGNATQKLRVSTATVHQLQPNEYQWDYSFPTNDIIYWKKQGNDWVAMTLAEQADVDSALQQKVTDDATSDVDMDALFKLIVHLNDQSVKNKNYAYVTNYFKNAVSLDKADKKKKKNSSAK